MLVTSSFSKEIVTGHKQEESFPIFHSKIYMIVEGHVDLIFLDERVE